MASMATSKWGGAAADGEVGGGGGEGHGVHQAHRGAGKDDARGVGGGFADDLDVRLGVAEQGFDVALVELLQAVVDGTEPLASEKRHAIFGGVGEGQQQAFVQRVANGGLQSCVALVERLQGYLCATGDVGHEPRRQGDFRRRAAVARTGLDGIGRGWRVGNVAVPDVLLHEGRVGRLGCIEEPRGQQCRERADSGDSARGDNPSKVLCAHGTHG